MLRRGAYFVIFLLVSLVTQVGGMAFLLCWLVRKWIFPDCRNRWQRACINAALFAAIYAVLHTFIVPPVAAIFGRVPLPCAARADRPLAAGNSLVCVLDRNYVDARLVTLLTNLAVDTQRAFPGTVTLFLDANFPFLNGFPLLPHLSHADGRKVDLAYYYAAPDGTYQPGRLRSPIGYWAFEQPTLGDKPLCSKSWLSLRWDMTALQSLYPALQLDVERTHAALKWLTTDGARFGVERIFIEPYVAERLGVSSPILGFQGCRAARHDDHIHIQIK